MDEITSFSPPGLYEVVTHEGPVYVVEVPEDVTDVSRLAKAKKPGEIKALAGHVCLTLVEFNFTLSQRGRLVIMFKDDVRAVETELVATITQIG